MLVRAAPGLAHKSHGVRIVHHHQGIVLVGQFADGRQIGQRSIHGKDAVGGDQAEAASLGLAQLGLEVGHVVVAIAKALGFAEANAVDDAGVIQFIGDDRILFAQERFKQPAVGVETGTVEQRVVGLQEFAEAAFEVFVDLLRSANKPHRRQPIAPLRKPLWAAAMIRGSWAKPR